MNKLKFVNFEMVLIICIVIRYTGMKRQNVISEKVYLYKVPVLISATLLMFADQSWIE